MKGEELFRAVGQVGDDLIARAEKTPARQASRWRPLAALAACCVLLVGIAALVLPSWLGARRHLRPAGHRGADAAMLARQQQNRQHRRARSGCGGKRQRQSVQRGYSCRIGSAGGGI